MKTQTTTRTPQRRTLMKMVSSAANPSSWRHRAIIRKAWAAGRSETPHCELVQLLATQPKLPSSALLFSMRDQQTSPGRSDGLRLPFGRSCASVMCNARDLGGSEPAQRRVLRLRQTKKPWLLGSPELHQSRRPPVH